MYLCIQAYTHVCNNNKEKEPINVGLWGLGRGLVAVAKKG